MYFIDTTLIPVAGAKVLAPEVDLTKLLIVDWGLAGLQDPLYFVDGVLTLWSRLAAGLAHQRSLPNSSRTQVSREVMLSCSWSGRAGRGGGVREMGVGSEDSSWIRVFERIPSARDICPRPSCPCNSVTNSWTSYSVSVCG